MSNTKPGWRTTVLLRREWWANSWFVCEDTPMLLSHCASSLKWMCCQCGEAYAALRAFQDNKPQPYHFLQGLCRHCSNHGNRFLIPGSVETPRLHYSAFPREMLAYQLKVELTFLDHPQHPHNKDTAA